MNKTEYEEMKKKIEKEEIIQRTTLIYISGKPQKIISHRILIPGRMDTKDRKSVV